MYIHELPNWPNFSWNNEKLAIKLADIKHRQGFLLGKMSGIGFDICQEASLEVMTADIIKSSAIEGEKLDQQQVRSSLARHLGIPMGGLVPSNRNVDGFVDMLLDSTQHYQLPLTKDRLFGWHNALFPTGRSGLQTITVGAWRTPEVGPMQVVSGPIGHERVHFEAPAAQKLEDEMKRFLDWFNKPKNLDPILQAGIAHFWFVTIHPFEDGNGRIARVISDMCLARSDGMSTRFYSLSSRIERERKEYYAMLESESSQKQDLDITRWLEWFLDCLGHAIDNAEEISENVLKKAKIWKKLAPYSTNERQRKVIQRLLNGDFQGKLTTSKYAKLSHCSQDTALRDIQSLMTYGVMEKEPGGGRSTNYQIIFGQPKSNSYKDF